MKHFKDTNSKPFSYEDDVTDTQIAIGLTAITQAEYEALIAPTPEEVIAQMIAEGEALIEAHIQEPIDEYNLENGVKFAHAHTCANYKDEVGYIHQVFCQQAWSFNVAVWEVGRLIQIDVLAGTISPPTVAEFKAMLPVFGA